MIKLIKLFSDPEIFNPIIFKSGLNLILGEKSESSNKTNGVGKSISIEFLNYCLLKKASDSRVLNIPTELIDPSTNIKLELYIHSHHLTIIRNIGDPDKVAILINDLEKTFDSLEDASEYLGNLYFEGFLDYKVKISLRNLLAPIIRDEKSEFKDIIKCYDTDKNIPRDYKPHLFFLGLNLDLYSEIRKIIDSLEKKTKYASETKKLLTNNQQIKISEAKARLNELDHEVASINNSIEKLRNKDSYDLIQTEIIALETKVSELRTIQKATQFEIKQIESLPIPEDISEQEIKILFNNFKEGLGDIVSKSIEEVKVFKNKIDGFRNYLVGERLAILKEGLFTLNSELRVLDESYTEKLSLIEKGELLKDLKTSLNIFNNKNEELNNLKALINRFDIAENEKEELKILKNNKLHEFRDKILEKQEVIKSFEQTILLVHERIMDNRKAHFEIQTVNKANVKDFLYFDLRTDDDGSHSTDRVKVLIYDIALLFNEQTSKRHPKFLVHDNIFDIDQDSLEKSLIFLHNQEKNNLNDFQYILTLNRDILEAIEQTNKLGFNIENYKRASYTKENRFLKKKYTEVKRRK
ncbi:DUF2326 domain-containing protein [Leptospira bouyouniensis]|uniref:DUF2326 domain-containing protein n=1 Tax=Leptospira bouyouniensis TaxID=2484911 RepID=A0A7I0HN04_9LEPT|nr:DUF2326 domain-containing protein [Leptospira bouyouniensis]TGL01907.1 DUF2326 domain-containing protein [Leptospira bouyouniensis]